MGEELVGTFIMRFRLQRQIEQTPSVSEGRRACLQRSWGNSVSQFPPLAPAALLSLHMQVLHSVVEYLGECSLPVREHMICLCSFFFS